MELRELKYFLAVAQEGSISAAAEYLYMTQPSLSRQMQNLKKRLAARCLSAAVAELTLRSADFC